MTRIIRSASEVEGVSSEEYVIVEGEEPAPWRGDTRLEVVGKAAPRIDGAARVTGRAIYTSDVYLSGMLYAHVLRSPHPHARVLTIDSSRARALPGVRAVISTLETPQPNVKAFDPALRYAGQEVAAVAAEDETIAADAVQLIDVEYETLPFVLDGEAALRPGAPGVQPQGNLVNGQPRQYRRGDVERGFREADIVVEETFSTQSAVHNCLEPHGTVAAWDGGSLTVWESTQSIYMVRDELAEAFGLPLDRVRVICEYMGGGFGSKQRSGRWSLIAALLARLANRPVKLMYDRKGDSLAGGNRAPTVQHLKLGARRDGSLSAIELYATSGIGAYGGMSLAIEGPAQALYACPDVFSEVRSAYTNTGPSKSFRGPGSVEGAFPLESLMDELAVRLAMDPIEFRMKNYAAIDPIAGKPYSAKHLEECYRTGADMIGWEAGRRAGPGSGRMRRGFGMASQMWGGGGNPPAYAWVRVEQDGAVTVITGSQDIGTGTRTVFAQIAAEELGLKPCQVNVHLGDTRSGPYDPVSWGSITVSSVGPAVRQAAIDVRRQLTEIAAGFLDTPAGDIEVKGGNIYVRGKAEMTLGDLREELGDFTVLGKGARGPNKPGADVRTFGAQFAEVEVDTFTGEVRVLRVVSAHDCGRVINPLGAASQVEGAVVQGIGYALTEARVTDAASGIVLNPNLEDYLLPTALDFDDIGSVFIDRADERANSIGAKGLGEPAMIPTAPAIANALYHATGVRFLSIPITRDKVLLGLEQGGAVK